ncbi:hypothetical protein [Shewanella sp. GD04112]|uniref:hypothetical protein n=1 Tax=Shewanella sp. GD04112 TaxID=2975434 RepID=UPI00244CF0C1|nr:hypothetical protein [Shewanella sp. GD04112]MDH0450861.1 hypothetical protein [Shewanella sp. GD04112]
MTTENVNSEKLEPTIGALAEPEQAAPAEVAQSVAGPTPATPAAPQGLSPVKMIMVMAGLVLLFGVMKFGMSFFGTGVSAEQTNTQSKIVVADLGEMFQQWSKESVNQADLSSAAQELGQLYFDMGYLVIDSSMTLRIPEEFKMEIPRAEVLLRIKQIRSEYQDEGKVPPSPQQLLQMATELTGN